MTIPVRGITLHNLTNIRKTDDKWQGAAVEQPDPDFVAFIADKWGLRACARILIMYQDKLGKGTISVSEIISRWAPSNENSTGTYTDNVCGWCDLTSDQQIDITVFANMFPIVRAIVRQEVGIVDYDSAVLTEALKLAGIIAPLPPVTKSPVFTVGAATAVLASTTPVLQQATQLVSTASPILMTMATIAPYVVGALLIMGAAYLVIHELQKRKVQA